MFTIKNSKVAEEHYKYTLPEIIQQPRIWRETEKLVREARPQLDAFLEKVKSAGHKPQVIFTGAGTSEYVGNTIADYLQTKNRDFVFRSIGTTSLVSNPKLFFKEDRPTLLVSFARSGNSPESIAAVDRANQLVGPIFQMALTCAPDGALAKQLKDQDNAFVLIMPEGTNDNGFAMTSSFSSMMLSALLVFDTLSDDEKAKLVESIARNAEYVLEQTDRIHELMDIDLDRLVYLGSGPLYGLAREARLKILELTAGQVVAIDESSMGFRHGPKSIINKETVVVDMVSNDDYTRLYDQDILNEVHGDGIAKKTIALTARPVEGDYEVFQLPEAADLEDVWLAFPYIVIAQLFALIASVHVGNQPDTPSATGTVNRVVKGVEIHAL